MKRDDLDAFLADVMAEHLVRLKDELAAHVERLVAAKALPPFVPPPIWVAGLHGAGMVVRHRNGLFSARRDTVDEPPSDAWLPLVVGVAGIDLRWDEADRAFVCRAMLSDGAQVYHRAEIAVPIERGYWNAEATYYPGDRTRRFGEYSCTKMCMGIDPTSEAGAEYWEKVGGKYPSMPSFKLDEDGTWSSNGREIGSMKPMVRQLLAELLQKHAA